MKLYILADRLKKSVAGGDGGGNHLDSIEIINNY